MVDDNWPTKKLDMDDAMEIIKFHSGSPGSEAGGGVKLFFEEMEIDESNDAVSVKFSPIIVDLVCALKRRHVEKDLPEIIRKIFGELGVF